MEEIKKHSPIVIDIQSGINVYHNFDILYQKDKNINIKYKTGDYIIGDKIFQESSTFFLRNETEEYIGRMHIIVMNKQNDKERLREQLYSSFIISNGDNKLYIFPTIDPRQMQDNIAQVDFNYKYSEFKKAHLFYVNNDTKITMSKILDQMKIKIILFPFCNEEVERINQKLNNNN